MVLKRNIGTLADHQRAKRNISRLQMAPLRLKKKVGDKKLPIIRLPTKIRNKLTHRAIRQPKKYTAINVTTFARPGFTPGNGVGKAASAMCMVMAKAANQIIMWSSLLVVSA